jgi:hypothetical protein
LIRRGKLWACAITKDETGQILFNLYGEQVIQTKIGQLLKILSAFTEVKEGNLEISSWKTPHAM